MPTDLALVHPLRQPRGVQNSNPNQCHIKRCQHLCIVGRNNESASCYCPPSSSVEEDGISCSSKKLFNLFIVFIFAFRVSVVYIVLYEWGATHCLFGNRVSL